MTDTLNKKRIEKQSVASDANSTTGAPNMMKNTSNLSSRVMNKQFSQIRPAYNRPRFLLKSKLSSKSINNFS
jgi:hypothetical protein